MPAGNVRNELLTRRVRLEALASAEEAAPEIRDLLRDVDRALERLDAGTYGMCETCGEEIEPERLEADPLVRFCVDHLTPGETKALQQDLELAGQVQQALLPPALLSEQGWEMAYSYHPLGPVSGDYCDVVRLSGADGDLVFLLGDISGKGVAASMLMAHLHATVRTLLGLGLPLGQVLQRANRIFCDSTMSNHYATLVCTRLGRDGCVEISNAGHCPPLLVHGTDVVPIEATGVPIGLFCVKDYASRHLALAPGDALVLYTDGLSEARNAREQEYGVQRLAKLVASAGGQSPRSIVSACVHDLQKFRAGSPRTDDVTVMAIKRVGQA